MATISDVAKLSGLSVSTVSRVINNKPHVSEAKRQRVQEAMDALGYSPLQAARQMVPVQEMWLWLFRRSRITFLLIWLIQSKEHAANMHTGR